MKPCRIMFSRPRTPCDQPQLVADRARLQIGRRQVQAGRQLARVGARRHRQEVARLVGRRPGGERRGADRRRTLPNGPRASATPTTSHAHGGPCRRAYRAARATSAGSRGPRASSRPCSRSATACSSAAADDRRARAGRAAPSRRPPTIGVRAPATKPASTASTFDRRPARRPRSCRVCDALRRAAARPRRSPRTRRARRRRSLPGRLARSRGGEVLAARMSQPPVTASGSAYASRVAVSMTAETVRLSTTSANIVSVRPVRKRLDADVRGAQPPQRGGRADAPQQRRRCRRSPTPRRAAS